MAVSGIGRSLWEDLILESFFNIPSVSAARLLKIASQQGIPLYTIDKSNIDLVLPQLQVSQEVVDDVKNAVNADKKVIISKSNIQYNDWNGVGYIILDPVQGSAAYKISGGLAGGTFSKLLPSTHRELEALRTRFCHEFRRLKITAAAISFLGTPYKMGCKDPNLECGGIDCSGLVSSCYAFAGVKSVVGTDANGQYNAAKETDYPFYGDLVFWTGTYDRKRDCFKNEADQVTHVGIVLPFGWMIHASGSAKEVILARISSVPSERDEEKATKIISCTDPKDAEKADINNGYCPKGCAYSWDKTGRKFTSFMGYGYAGEFDEECPKKK